MIAASAAALCLAGGLLTGCGGSPGDGYAAVGAAGGGPERSAGGGAGRPGPSGKVTLVPLDGEGTESGGGEAGGPAAGPTPGTSSPPAGGSGGPGAVDGPAGGSSARLPGPGPGGGGSGSGARTGAPGGSGAGATVPGAGSGAGAGKPSQPAQPGKPAQPPKPGEPPTPGGGSTPGNGSEPGGGGGTTTPAPSPPPGEPAPPPAPATLTLGAPQRAPADKRWCEKVTVEFRNTGGSPARSGTITFATHVIGALGVDWATIRSSQSLPAPIAAGATRSETYTVCVESWRVPLGMRVETQDVSAVWE